MKKIITYIDKKSALDFSQLLALFNKLCCVGKKIALSLFFPSSNYIGYLLKSIIFIILCLSMLHVMADNPPAKRPSLPTLPLDLGATGTFSFSENATSYRFIDDRILIKANVGWGYFQKNTGVAGVDIGWLMSKSSTLGLNLSYQRNKLEAVLHHVKYWLPLGLRWKGSFGYMSGRQNFNFLKSSAKAKLSQSAYYASVDWLDISKLDVGLQSVGMAAWGGKSKNHSQFDTQVYIDDVPDYYVITRDQRLLSAGQLMGMALDFQYAPRYFNLVFKGSLGHEWLKFPWSDGSAEKVRSLYLDVRVDHQLNSGDMINAGYKRGVTERRVELGYQRKSLNLTAFHSQGRNGLEDQRGVNLSLDVLALFNAKKQMADDRPLAAKLRPTGIDDVKLNQTKLLRESILRSPQLPSTFMVKVDPTGVSRIRVEKTTLPSTATITPQGNIFIPVAQGNSTVTSVQVNGRSVSVIATQFSTQGNQLIIFAENLPQPINKDSYMVQLDDSTTGETYIVTFDAVNG